MPKAVSVLDSAKFNTLSKSLFEAFGKTQKERRRSAWDDGRKGSSARVDIVNEKACDDIIEYLAPTLEQHKGCSIIDVHPGACLFSSKLHDYLKPKCHLLMEPEAKYVEPFIQPLLNKPGSTYRHTLLSGAHPTGYWDNYKKVLSDPSLLPPRPELPAGDSKLRQFDPSLLVIGSLARHYMIGKISLASMMFHQSAYGVLANEHFQRSGLVRMLWWIPERVKHEILRRNTQFRTALSVSVEMGVDAREVAGVKSLMELQDAIKISGRSRADFYNQLGHEHVAKRAQVAGMSPPEDRKLLGVDVGQDSKVLQAAHKSPFASLAETPSQLEGKISTARKRLEGIVEVKARPYSSKKALELHRLLETVEFPQSQPIVKTYAEQSLGLSRHRGPLFMDMALRVLHIEASYKNIEDRIDDETTLSRLKSAVLQLDEDVTTWTEQASKIGAKAVDILTEEQISFYIDAAQTPWEKRPFEPLQLSSTDFFPTGELTLFDLIPKTRDLSVPDLADNHDAARVCKALVQYLFHAPSHRVTDTLNGFAINMGNDLVPMVPAITDIRKGGRLNPHKVKARMLTEEMIEGLVKAFYEWPFRPQTHQLAAMGTSGGEGEASTEDASEVLDAEAPG